MQYLYYVILGLISYFIGNINWARVIAYFKHGDVTKSGSGNPGTLNVWRTFGFWPGVMTFLLDAVKGVIPTLVAYLTFGYIGCVPEIAMYVAGFSVVLGHVFPIVFKFKGGKGFATTIGAFLVLQPMWTAIFIVIGLILLIAWDYMSVFALFFATALFVQNTVRFFTEPFIAECGYIWIFIVVMAIVWLAVIIAHRSNIKRLLTGCENKTGIRKAFSKKKKASSENNNDEKI